MNYPATIQHNLPYQHTPFIGRAEEIVELSQLLHEPACRLLTLTGPGGIGKTRLVVELAARQLDHFPDGIYFVPLQPLAPETSILGTIIEALPIRATRSSDLWADLERYLCERNILLVLDNFEHLLDQAGLVSDILAAAPRIKVLVTSREALNLQEEWVRQIKGLSYPRQLVEPGEQYDAVRLFAERARQVNDAFSLTDEFEQAVSICQIVEGMPLALELAAAWRKRMSSARIVQNIIQSLDFLTVDTRNMPQRHRSMRSVFEQSWQMLTSDEQAVFRKLAVFRGGWTLEAAQSVAGATLSILARLTDQSLVRLDNNDRYSLHELLRQFGEEQLVEADELEAAQQTHCHYFAHFLQQRETDVRGHGDVTGQQQFEAYYEISMDLKNVRAAWLWAVEHRDFQALDQGLECLYRYAANQMLPLIDHELFPQVSKRLAPQGDEMPTPTWGRIVVRSVFHHSSEINRQQLERALLLAQQQNNIAEIGHSFWALGLFAYKNLQFALALKWYEQCLSYYRQLRDPFYIADGLIWVGVCHCCLGHLDEADRYLRQNLDLRPSFGDRNGEYYARLYRSNLLLLSGNFDGAESDLNAAFAITQSDDPVCVFFWSHACNGGSLLMRDTWRGFFALIRGDHETAQLYRHALLRSANDHRMVNARTYLLHLVGFAITLNGDYQRGAQLLEWVCHHFSLNPWFERPLVHWGLALAKVSLEADAEARQWLLALFKDGLRMNSAMVLTLGLPIQAVILARSGEPAPAVALLALASTHPKSAKGWMENWPVLRQVQANLHTELGAATYSAAWKHGTGLDLESTCRDLLAELQTADLTTLSNNRHPDTLTPREQEVLRLMARGHSNREIAEALVLSIGTVKGYVYNVCQKLGVQNRTQAAVRAREQYLL